MLPFKFTMATQPLSTLATKLLIIQEPHAATQSLTAQANKYGSVVAIPFGSYRQRSQQPGQFQSFTQAKMADSFSPPQQVRANAKRGLELRAKYGRGGTEVGVARARDLSNGKSLSLDTIKRMVSYFARHEVDKKGEGWGVDSAGYIAWLLWGGDAGRSWANRINNENNAKEKTMNLELAYSYAGIIKSEKQEDGTLKVYGKATDDAIDIDQQICDETWLKEAMPDWFTSGGNIREQHSNIAAGVATDYESKADGHYITALIVDPVSVKKVETGVLKGFSIGIRGPRVIRDSKAAGGRIVGGQIVEVSVVDRPANPNAKMVIAKAVDGGELQAVRQTSIPTPAEAFKSVEPAIVEESAEGEIVSEEITTEVEAPAEEVVAEVAAEENAPEEVATEEVAAEEVITPEDEIIEAAKSLFGTLNKFDKETFDRARTALAELIIVEAKEMSELGHDERHSLEELLDSVKHLFRWYEGEALEGEVDAQVMRNAEAGEMLEMAIDGEMCKECGKALEMCKCDYGKAADAEPEAEVAEEAAPAETNLDATDDEIAAIVEKAVTTAREAVSTEIAALKSAQEAALSKAAQLEEELATALTKAATGGPKRASLTKSNTLAESELIQKSAEYLQKAALTADKTLAEGYRELAGDFKLKAAQAARKEAN
jgi:hypothetical protein